MKDFRFHINSHSCSIQTRNILIIDRHSIVTTHFLNCDCEGTHLENIPLLLLFFPSASRLMGNRAFLMKKRRQIFVQNLISFNILIDESTQMH
jgi:hypothetical protein